MRISMRGLFLGAAFVLVLQACGGANANSAATGKTPESAAKNPSKSGAPSGAQTAVTDAPSSAGVDASSRPKMNAAAREVYMQALEAFGKGALGNAKSLFLEALRRDPKAYQAQYSLGVVLERLGEADATTRYREAFTMVPDYEPAITAYASYVARRGNLTEADQFLSEYHGRLPKSAAITAALAELRSMQRDTGSAQQLAQEALKLNPNYAPAMVVLARDHYRNRRLDLAQYALQAILDGFGADNPPRDKDNPEARLIRALIYKEEGRRAAAITELERVVTMRPDLVDAGVQLGAFYLEAGNADKALPLLERALQYDSDNVVGRLNLGDCYRLLGRTGEAKRQFEWVLARDSSRIEAHYDLGLLYLFGAGLPDMTPNQQAQAAIDELEKYKEKRGRSVETEGADVEQLLTRARAKKAALEEAAQASRPATAPSGSAPAASGSAAPSGSAPATTGSSTAPSGSAANPGPNG